MIIRECTRLYSPSRDVRLLETRNASEDICDIIEECDKCCFGFMVPVKYTDKQGNTYLFHEIVSMVKNMGQNMHMD